MGREIRRVPPGWVHPIYTGNEDEIRLHSGRSHWIGTPKPLFDEDFASAAREWLDNAIAWDQGTHEDVQGEEGDERKRSYPFYWQWDGNPPDPESYRPAWTEAQATHYQVYETVSEGTPTSPVFATLEELEDWLVSDQGHRRENAQAFCRSGYVPSMIFGPRTGFLRGIDAAAALEGGDAP